MKPRSRASLRFSRTPSTSKERGRYFPDDSEDKGRLLSAGYHNVMGYFRDDTPLMELILDEKGQKQLEPPVGRIRLHRRLHGAHLGSVFLQPERRGAGQGRRIRLARVRSITRSPTPRSSSECGTPIWPRPQAEPKNDPIALRGDPRSLRARQRHASRVWKRSMRMPSRSISTRFSGSPRAPTAGR